MSTELIKHVDSNQLDPEDCVDGVLDSVWDSCKSILGEKEVKTGVDKRPFLKGKGNFPDKKRH